MPWEGQTASKMGHAEILRNPDVQAFLDSCQAVPTPSADDVSNEIGDLRIADFNGTLPSLVLAIDGSAYEASADGRYPSRLVGYIKVSMVGLDMTQYRALSRTESRNVDPMEVARLQNQTTAFSMALPGAYVLRPGFATVVDGFRAEVQRYLRSDRTSISATNSITLYDTLVYLGRLAGWVEEDAGGAEAMLVGVCPAIDCEAVRIQVPLETGEAACPTCGVTVYASDTIPISRAFVESGSNGEVYGRLMLASEHLLAAHYIRWAMENNLQLLSRLCIVMDGPLAIAGQPSRIAMAMMKLIKKATDALAEHNLPPPTIFGVSKTGRAIEHFKMIDDHIPRGTVFALTDAYRYRYIFGQEPGDRIFGEEFYYGQDFVVKTESGHIFLVCVAYPWDNKKEAGFRHNRFDASKYVTLGNVLEVVKTFESDLYGSSMVPLTLAHEFASISLKPGGKVLDIATLGAMAS